MDVDAWLRDLGLGQYEGAFRDNAVDAEILPRLTAEDLKDLGVASVGHRRKLLDAISRLQSAPEPPAPSTEVSPSDSSPPAPLPKGSEVAAERRPIAVMFCDLMDSTSISAALDAEDWRNLVSAYLDAASEAVTKMGGRVAKTLGDGLMALFGHPVAQENDSERAVRAALAIQRALAELNRKNAGSGRPELAARVGVESGAVVVDEAGEIFGDAPNIAARVQALAEPGSVMVTARVQHQVAGLFVAENLGAHALKGAPGPTTLFRIVRASGGRRSGGRAFTPLVGRWEELDLLRRRWERAARGEGQFVQIVGEPGIGKSRLVEEFRRNLGETPHTFVEWSSSQLLHNTPLHPIAEWGRQRFGSDEPAAGRLADLENTLRLIGLDPGEYAPLLAPLVDIPLPQERAAKLGPEELRRRQLAALVALVLAGARSQPVVLAFEDLHWADPTSLDLAQALAERGAQGPLFILATARPEFRPQWSLRSHHSVISLSPLGRADVAQMVGELAARHPFSKEVIESVGERTGGVPLFVEEVTRLLLERGEHSGAQVIPLTLQQSLAARLDRLGPAREVAQIGAVLGRDFAYALLRAVGGVDDPALQSALERLAGADLLIVEGAGPQAIYRFKHALIQDAAYDSLLKSRRQALHRRAAELLRDDPESTAAEPEVIAHHFEQAGLDDLAIEWWGKAGDQALRRSAFQEAISHLGKAIEMADKTGEGTNAATASPSADQRLKLQTSLGQALMFSRGFSADESRAAFIRARELAAAIDNPAERFAVYYGLWIGNQTRGEFGLAREIAEAFLSEAEPIGRTTERLVARRTLGTTRLFQGDLIEAQANFVEALSTNDSEGDHEAGFRFGADIGATVGVFAAIAKWLLGEVGPSRVLIEAAIAHAIETGHIPTLVNCYTWKALLEILCGDAGAARRDAEMGAKLSQEKALGHYSTHGALASAWASSRLDGLATGATNLRQALAAWTDLGNKALVPFFEGLLAEIEAEGDVAGALTRIDEALALVGETGEHWSDAFLHRLRGDILLMRDPEDSAPAEDAFLTAIAVARQQKARSFELRAALDLVRLYHSTSRSADAHAFLASALEGFSPTPELPEIAEAQALLAALAETEEVKAAIAQRQRRLHLQTAYGQALQLGKGFAAEETKAAFVRVGEFARPNESPAARFAAYYAQCIGSFFRGEFSVAQEMAETFLREAEADGRATEAGTARRQLGLVLFFKGELKAAQSFLERASADSVPDRDGDARRIDGQSSATAILASAVWHLGEVERARLLIQQALGRARELGHAATTALVLNWNAYLEIRRDDVAAARLAADASIRLAEEHGMNLFAGNGEVCAYWARGRLVDPEEGASGLRQALQALLAEGNKADAPFFHGMLAELEAAARGPDSALTLIDQGLTIAEETGGRFMEPYLHRLRGDILLKRDPADPTPAEDAYRTAIAVARQQGARSYELLASLSLARLYQSTGRSDEAPGVLAPALEGFTPTAEMPEIAEAQALSVALDSRHGSEAERIGQFRGSRRR